MAGAPALAKLKDNKMKEVFTYILSRLDSTNAWFGLLGIILQAIGFHFALIIMFLAMFVLPEGNFSSIFKTWTNWLRKIEKEIE